MIEKKGEGEKELGAKTEKEEKAWLKWADVKKRLDELHAEVEALKGEKTLNAKQFESVLSYAVLALYTLIPPRRNQDYTKAVVVKKWTEKMPTDKNYLDLGGVGKPTQFIFNVYKTAKKHGQYKAPIPEELATALNLYLQRHPGRRAGRKAVSRSNHGSRTSATRRSSARSRRFSACRRSCTCFKSGSTCSRSSSGNGGSASSSMF
jgi:hypothetical protein